MPEADLSGWTCPLPLRDYDRIVIGHGGGGQLSSELVEHLFVPAFNGTDDVELHDAATFDVAAGRLAFSTDSYVVQPLFFPGGCIGDLAVNGTVNDVAMTGARPTTLSAGFILEEGLELGVLGRVVEAMAAAARAADVRIVTGDTKVVNAGQADGMYVNTAGIGVVPEGIDIRPSCARPGDAIILSGPIGAHGIAVMSSREGLEFGTDLESDSAPLHGLVAAMLDAFADVHVLRDATRGGVTASLCEISNTAHLGVEYEETSVPVPAAVAAACSFLGLDAMGIANEGRLVAMVPPEGVDQVMDAMHGHPQGRDACVIGRVVEEHPGLVVARTALGASRVVDLPLGEQLPRIC
ncbi:MAG TPA: hydrogenase expression/formation protein HypE [Acidimicrobiales bacterium]|nr:hydrogenase expression/formation protein HypE [Acidimicrobiales bacterium]